MRNSRLFSVEKQHDENGRRCSCDFFFYYQDIDDYICHAKDKSYDTLMHFGRKGLNVAATAAVMAATKVMQTPNICFVLTRGPLFFFHQRTSLLVRGATTAQRQTAGRQPIIRKGKGMNCRASPH